MRNAIIVLVIVLLVGGGGYIAWTMMDSNKEDSGQESTSESNDKDDDADDEMGVTATDEAIATNEVSYDSDGFLPATISVEVGTKVTWTNDSGADMWVASDPHPVHTDFSRFDQLKSGDSYSFTFEEAGTYEYHNHLNSGDTGSVVVK